MSSVVNDVSKSEKISIIDIIISNEICSYVDNESNPIIGFVGSDLNDWIFEPKVVYNSRNGGIVEMLRRLIKQYDNVPYGFFSPLISRNKLAIDIFKIGPSLTKDNMMKCPSLHSDVIGIFSNQAYINTMVTYDYVKQTVDVNFAGTSSLFDILVDVQFETAPIGITRYDEMGVYAHVGALKQLTTNGLAYQLIYVIVEVIRNYSIQNKVLNPDLDSTEWEINIRGYSLGAMQACLFLLLLHDNLLDRNRQEIVYENDINNGPIPTIFGRFDAKITYNLGVQGCPPIGNRKFNEVISQIITGTFEERIITKKKGIKTVGVADRDKFGETVLIPKVSTSNVSSSNVSTSNVSSSNVSSSNVSTSNETTDNTTVPTQYVILLDFTFSRNKGMFRNIFIESDPVFFIIENTFGTLDSLFGELFRTAYSLVQPQSVNYETIFDYLLNTDIGKTYTDTGNFPIYKMKNLPTYSFWDVSNQINKIKPSEYISGEYLKEITTIDEINNCRPFFNSFVDYVDIIQNTYQYHLDSYFLHTIYINDTLDYDSEE